MKKKILSLSIIVLCLAILSGSTIAYFTAEDTARNVITSGGICIEVVEQQKIGDEFLPYPDEPIQVMPGAPVSKIVSVKSLEQSAWVRMRYTVTVFDAAGKAMNLSSSELAKLILITPDGENWTYREGWWYCNQIVKQGQTSKPLFELVDFCKTMDNRYQGSTVQIDVTAQAVQSANNGTGVLQAAGWPEN